MAKKLKVGVIFGGRSGEHEVSLLSAASILKAIDYTKFEVAPIGITKDGQWLAGDDARALLEGKWRKRRAGAAKLAGKGSSAFDALPTTGDVRLDSKSIDVIFPVLHGTFGEDGTIQGLFEMAGVAYVGSGVLGSSAGMDKDLMKRLFLEAGLPIVKHVTLLRSEFEKSPRKAVARIEAALKYPLFVKPANCGSSVGISKAHDRKELGPALREAARFDRKLVVEEGVGGKRGKARELEVGVLGNDAPKASVVGEITPDKEFYDYEAKYQSEGSKLQIPAQLSREEAKTIREMAVRAFQVCDLAGLSRVDFLMEPGPKRRIYVNEVNTLPGFTKISMYPKLWEATGVEYTALITRLIELALERHGERKRTQFSKD
jgi:D-alanine-D-alanine ligase